LSNFRACGVQVFVGEDGMTIRSSWGLFLVILLAFACRGFAADGSSLKPPARARVAVVVFEDLECPACGHAYPIIWQNANAAHVPVVLHDYPLTKHPWAFDAALYARFFDTKSQKLGNDFRAFIYQNQPQINVQNLKQYAEKFANDNHVPLPFVIDPQGKLKAEIQADRDLGQKCNLTQTPTIFVVGGGSASPTFLEVTNLENLPAMIQEMQKRAGPVPSPSPARRAASKAH
jgi:protein-disulfide isomerase